MVVSASSEIAIIEKGLKFGWCQSGKANHFRQVYCYLENNPICIDCANVLRLRVADCIEVSFEKINRKKGDKTNQKKKKLFIRRKQTSTRLENKILKALKDKCFSSRDLYVTCGDGRSFDTFSAFLRKRVKQGKLIQGRQSCQYPMLYALPTNKKMLLQTIGRPSVEDQILSVLKESPASVKKLVLQTQRTRSVVYDGIKRLKDKGLISTVVLPISGKQGRSLQCSLSTIE